MSERWEYKDVTFVKAGEWHTVWVRDRIKAFERDRKKAIKAFVEAVKGRPLDEALRMVQG